MGLQERRRYLWRVLAVVTAAFMIRVDFYIVSISLPSISRFFGVTTGESVYVNIAYLLFVASTMLLLGRLEDRFGLRRMLLLGYLLFVAGSFLCGVSTSLSVLIAFRCLQGLGGALLFTSAFGIVPKIVPREIQGWAYGLWSMACGLGAAIGALLGGIISGIISWRWIFFINVPVGIAAVFFVLRAIPHDRVPADSSSVRGRSIDIGGALLSLFGLSAFILALNRGPTLGWASAPVIASFAASVVLLGSLALRERRKTEPLIPFELLKNRDLRSAVLAALAGYMVLSGNCFLLPFYLELAHGIRSQLCGLMILIYALTFIFIAPRAGRASDRIDPRRLGALAMLLLVFVFGGFSLTASLPGLLPVMFFLLGIGVAFSFFFPPNNHLSMKTVSNEERGIASGIYQTSANLGMVMGICLFETVFSQTAGRIWGASLPGRGMIEVLLRGFRNAYLVGAIICLGGFFIFAISMRKSEFR